MKRPIKPKHSDVVESEPIDARTKYLRKINKGRRAQGLIQIDCGFNYVLAISHINTKRPGGLPLQGIANCMGVSLKQLEKFQRGDNIPDHMAGEALWGLYKELFVASNKITFEKMRANLLKQEQIDGGELLPLLGRQFGVERLK